MTIFRRRTKRSEHGHSWFGLHQPFDAGYRLVTSGTVKPWVLFLIRLLLAIWSVAAGLAHIILSQAVLDEIPFKQYYVYFTRLTFIGLTSYFCAAAFHSGFFVLSLRQLKKGEATRAPWYPLQKWGRVLQFLHLALFSTIITYPIIVTVVYWAILASSQSFSSPFYSWSNIAFHALNSVLLLVELIFGRVRLYLGYWIVCAIVLALYLGMAYLVHSVQDIWVYGFLDPQKPGAHVAAYIVGILVAETVELPPGWEAQWNAEHQRYLFIEIETGQSQWEPPTFNVWDDPAAQEQQALLSPNTPAGGGAGGHTKRRQYAAEQTQAYSGNTEPSYGGGGAGAGAYYGGGGAPPGPGQPGPGEGGGFFTPGLAGEQPFSNQQQGAQGGYYGGGAGGGGYGQPPQQGAGWYGGAATGHPPNPLQGHPDQQTFGAAAPGPGYGQPGSMAQLTNQFSQMGMKPFSLYTANLLQSAPDPLELMKPPPEIRLAPGSSVTQSPYANADPSYTRSTINAVPTTSSLLSKSKLPFSLVITPHRSVPHSPENVGEDAEGSGVDPADEPVPIIADQVIARCRRCRAYINPYVIFIDGGSRWKCIMCNVSNEVPAEYDWDRTTNTQIDRWSRPELNRSVVEFVAPTEYMVRPPQPPVYVFLLDVSPAAVQTGMLATATRTILESLGRIPNTDGRTKIAIIAYDVALYFFAMSSTTPAPPAPAEGEEGEEDTPAADKAEEEPEISMLVVSDLDDVYLPRPNDILVNLSEQRKPLESLLGRINEMFAGSTGMTAPGMHGIPSSPSAMGPALQAGYKLISPIGGKLLVLSASLPTLGAGALKDRDDPKLFGTSKESNLLQPASPFYKTFAIDCSRSQVSVDMFLFSAGYTDIATLSCLPRYTAGQTYFYPAFNAARSEDALKFAHEFGEVLASPIGLEAVIRVRASRGLRMTSFNGNFFVRSTDLLSLAAVPVDQTYTMEVIIEETLTVPFVVFQTAVLHTSCFGERRIRVVNLALPTTSSISELYSSVDQIALATILAQRAVERSLSHKLEDARDAVANKLVDILSAYRTSMTAGGAGAAGQLAIAENMKMLPVLTLGIVKNPAIRQSSIIPSDLRAYSQALLTSIPPQLLIPYIHPCFYSLHDMAPEAGTIGERGIIMPAPLPLSSERLERHGLYLIEDGQTIFLWVGRDAVPPLVQDVFDVERYDLLQSGKITLPYLENEFNQRINAIIAKTREMRRGPYWPHLYLVKEDGEPALRQWALSLLIQDRGDQTPSYQQYLSMLREKVYGSGY
ncbi:COPII subunit [Serendipita sp. 405]|nr:COPII subunit [Serendipita sp. 405]